MPLSSTLSAAEAARGLRQHVGAAYNGVQVNPFHRFVSASPARTIIHRWDSSGSEKGGIHPVGNTCFFRHLAGYRVRCITHTDGDFRFPVASQRRPIQKAIELRLFTRPSHHLFEFLQDLIRSLTG